MFSIVHLFILLVLDTLQKLLEKKTFSQQVFMYFYYVCRSDSESRMTRGVYFILNVFIYLVAPGLSCGMHVGSSSLTRD